MLGLMWKSCERPNVDAENHISRLTENHNSLPMNRSTWVSIKVCTISFVCKGCCLVLPGSSSHMWLKPNFKLGGFGSELINTLSLQRGSAKLTPNCLRLCPNWSKCIINHEIWLHEIGKCLAVPSQTLMHCSLEIFFPHYISPEKQKAKKIA